MHVWSNLLKINGYLLICHCLRFRQLKRFKRRGQLKKNKIVKSSNNLASIHNTIVDFVKLHPNFKEYKQCKNIRLFKKTR